MHTDFSLHFQWANNHSEPVPYLCIFCQPKMPTGTIWSFSNAKADVCSCRQHGLEGFLLFLPFFFFFYPGFVCIIILFTAIGVFFWNEVQFPGCHELSFIREQRDSSLKKQACAAIEERYWYLIFTFSFGLPEGIFFCSFFSHQRRLYWMLHVWLDHYCII